MSIRPRGAGRPHDLQGLLGTLGAGLDKDELAIVVEIGDVALDDVLRQVIIGKMGPKGPGISMPIQLRFQIAFGIAPIHRRTRARRKDSTDLAQLFRHDGLIVNSVFKSRASQSVDGFVQVSGVVEYPNDGRCLHAATAYAYGSWDSGIGRQSWQEGFLLSRKLHDEPATPCSVREWTPGTLRENRVRHLRAYAARTPCVCVYQGEEIGMTNVRFESIEDIRLLTLQPFEARGLSAAVAW